MASWSRLVSLWAAASCGVSAQLLVDQTRPNAALERASACSLLSRTFPGSVDHPNSERYASAQSSYWASQQSDLLPACRYKPQNARQLQEALSDIILPCNVTFAVKSGGTSSNGHASNIDAGITIDMSDMGGAMVIDGREVLMGPAAKWEDVYAVTEPQNVTVAGARAGNVGVAGYLLGGGLSWFSSQYGWAVDGILEMEFITPMAEQLTLSDHSHEDLFWAVKGSGGAFGITTRLTVAAIPSIRDVYGGPITYDHTHLDAICSALIKLTNGAHAHYTTQAYLSITWDQTTESFTHSAYLLDTTGNNKNTIINHFASIPHTTSNLRTLTILECATDITTLHTPSAPHRRTTFTLTLLPSHPALTALLTHLQTSITSIQLDPTSRLSLTLQPLSLPPQSSPYTQPNLLTTSSLSISPAIIASVELTWTSAKKDTYFEQVARHLRELMEDALEEESAKVELVYPNYAGNGQQPLRSLDDATRMFLRRVREKYDPKGIWERRVPGVWKL